MIQDPVILKEITDDWYGVRRLQAMITTNLNFGFARGAVWTDDFANICHSLLLPFAFSVLERTLQQIRDEGLFPCRSNQFGSLMKASRPALQWTDFVLVDEARERRNELAHEQRVVPRADVWRYLDAIERELILWRILTGPVRTEHTISIRRIT
jgi:hypothetical protein